MSGETKLTKSEVIAFEKLRQKWKELSIEDIILDGLYLNCIRLVKEYTDKILKIDLKQSKIHEVGLKSVLQLLADKDLRGAEILLNHMNFDSNQKIYQICFFTLYKQLRNYLISVLIDRKKLNENELEMIMFLKKLEAIYSCRSFQATKESIQDYQWQVTGNTNKNFKPKDLITFKEESDDSTSDKRFYSHVVIEWIREWTAEMRQELLADSLVVNRNELTIQLRDINPNILFSVLVDQNNLKLLVEWIDFSFGEMKSDQDPAQIVFAGKITQEMVNSLGKNRRLMPQSKEVLLNCLARFNVFCSEEANNSNKQIARLSSSNTLFNTRLFKLKDTEFHSRFILNFGKLLPANFVWTYLDFYNNTISSTDNFEAFLLDQNLPLQLLYTFRNNKANPGKFITDLSLKNFEFVLSKSQNENPNCVAKNFKMIDLFDTCHKEFHLVTLALSLYCDTLVSSEEVAKLDHLLDEYPALHLILDLRRVHQPVNLYSLLQEHTMLDMTKCFNWQQSNSIGLFREQPKADGSFCGDVTYSSSLLSFENEELVKKYAFKESLDYAYFVRQGRPFFAYHFFIQNQINKFGKINKTLMEEAKLRNNLILIENFNQPGLVSSCLTFGELLNADTFKLKLNVYLMETLNEYYMQRGMERAVSAEKCITIFTEFFRGDLDVKRLVSIFEQVLVDIMIEKFDLKNMFTMNACSIWLPLMCFCKIHGLAYTCKYLQLCAESNEWLMFLLFAQMYQIPRYQVISSLEHFQDTGLKQHLEYALHNVINATSTEDVVNPAQASGRARSVTKRRSNRAFSKIVKDKGKDSSDDEDMNNDYETSLRSNEQYQISLDSIDFYELLINCQNVTDPVLQLQLESLRWSTPVLAVFATFYQQHDKISCLCTFLYSSMKLTCPNKNFFKGKNFHPKNTSQSILFGLDDLKEAVQVAASKSYLRTLLNALKIFIPNTILDIYVEFLYNVFVTKEADQAKQLYQVYRTEFTKVTLNKHQSYIPLEWYEEVINKLTRITLLKCPTIDDLHNLNDILPKGNDYCRLIKLVDILKTNKISVNSEDWLDIDDKSEQFSDICIKVIEELLKKQNFNEAEELAEYCELNQNIFHRIHLARIGRQIEVLRLHNDFEEILAFWQSAHVQLMKIGIKDSDFIDFLKFQNRRSHLIIERIVLLNLVGQLCPNDIETSRSLWQLLLHFVNDHKKKNELVYLKTIFRKMLLFNNLNKKNAIKELLDYVIEEGVANDFSDHNKNINEQDKVALDILLLNLVEIGRLTQAYDIAKHFKYYNQDLRILLNMLYICMDMIKPSEVDYNLHTFGSTSNKGIKLTNVLRRLSRASNSPDEIMKDRTEALEKLASLCNYGHVHCGRIKLDFRLANEFLHMSYTKLLGENEWTLLHAVLNSDDCNKFELARRFVKIYDLDQKELCDFMLREVLATLDLYVGGSQQRSIVNSDKKLMFDPTNDDEFSNLIKIFKPNSNQFGLRMYEESRRLLAHAKTTDDYIILTELLIRSHSFFSQSCSMEGISNVLQTSKMCATQLERAGEFNIMIRLLTGIGHFSEMTYIMDYLWNNHQFEMLFGKGIGKNDKLRLALLDYLKRYHPNDHETYTMVTLNFTMHREIAIMLEEAAYQQLKLLESKTIAQTPDILTDLQSILQYFSDAAQSFMKQDCVKHAESCIKKARLIALQIHFLSSSNIVINLTNAAASRFIINHPRFWESFIVSEAYEKKSEWPQVLFNQFILGNNEKYLNDFKNHIQLTPQMIEEVTNRFKIASESNRLSVHSVKNMKRLLKCSKDIGQYYRIVSLLEFNDCVAEMQKKSNFSIVNDLILNKKI